MARRIAAVIFDLGGTLVHWPDWDGDAPRRWALSYDRLVASLPDNGWPARDDYVRAMREAELAHWQRVNTEHWSGPPSGLLQDGFRRLGCHPRQDELLAALDGYAGAVDGWAQVIPEAPGTLSALRGEGYRVGLLSNTWWAAEWHNADLAAHGLARLIDELVYTSDLPHSKPHPAVFLEAASRLGVEPDACVMVGDTPADDIAGAQAAGMRGVWVRTGRVLELDGVVRPDACIDTLAQLPPLLRGWNA
jgi:putative hydrolase of the HAD superfamily